MWVCLEFLNQQKGISSPLIHIMHSQQNDRYNLIFHIKNIIFPSMSESLEDVDNVQMLRH